jgi:hypothetical protein
VDNTDEGLADVLRRCGFIHRTAQAVGVAWGWSLTVGKKTGKTAPVMRSRRLLHTRRLGIIQTIENAMAFDTSELSAGQLLDLVGGIDNGDLISQLSEDDEYTSRIIFAQIIERLGREVRSCAARSRHR